MSIFEQIESILKAYPQLDSFHKELILNAAKATDSMVTMQHKEAC